jgi:hypothetical protein
MNMGKIYYRHKGLVEISSKKDRFCEKKTFYKSRFKCVEGDRSLRELF